MNKIDSSFLSLYSRFFSKFASQSTFSFSSSSHVAPPQLKQFPRPILVKKRGLDLIHDPLLNKGTGFEFAERDRLGIRGLVPPSYFDEQRQVVRVLSRYKQNEGDSFSKYLYLSALQDRNETLFFRVLIENLKQLSPIVYTPTVGEVCLKFSAHVFRTARGMFFASEDKGHFSTMIYNWPRDVDLIVVTDGSRVLGLGDLGIHGQGITQGKLCLYSAAGGIDPAKVLPMVIDVGTNNKDLLSDPVYIGVQKKRLKGQEYFDIMDELVAAIRSRWPSCMIHFEDFSNENAQTLLDRYSKYCVFNDDIQGTGSVAYGGILTALRVQNKDPIRDLGDQKIVCLGAGSAGMGVCNQIYYGMISAGVPPDEARRKFWILDADGLVTHRREVATLSRHQRRFARDDYFDLTEGAKIEKVIEHVKPTILLGLSGVPSLFTEKAIKTMAKHVDRPIIFPMSNPVDYSECTAEQAYTWTNGKAIFASGSPFSEVVLDNSKGDLFSLIGRKTYLTESSPAKLEPEHEPVIPEKHEIYYPSQSNNMFIFPGLGLAVINLKIKKIPPEILQVAAQALAECVTDEELKCGLCFPDLDRIRDVSLHIATKIGEWALERNLVRVDLEGRTVEKFLEKAMYYPKYAPIAYTDDWRGDRG